MYLSLTALEQLFKITRVLSHNTQRRKVVAVAASIDSRKILLSHAVTTMAFSSRIPQPLRTVSTCPRAHGLLFESGGRLQPIELFKHLLTVEVVGAGFDKSAITRYFALRFPCVLKVFDGRLSRDATSFRLYCSLQRRMNILRT